MTVVDYTDYATPQAHADAISITGAPALNLHNAIISASGTILPGGITTIPQASLNQPGWELQLTLQIPAAATQPMASVSFDWQDSAGGITVWEDRWYLAAGSAAVGANTFNGRGKALGNALSFSIINNDGAQSLTYSVQIYQTSQYTPLADIQIARFGHYSAPGFNTPDQFADHLALGTRLATAVAASGVDNTLLPPFAGRVFLSAHTSSGANDLNVQIIDSSPPSASTNGTLWQGNTDANGNLFVELALTRCHFKVRMLNQAAVGRTLSYYVAQAEY